MLGIALRRFIAISAHVGLWVVALTAAFLLRFDFHFPRNYGDAVLVWYPLLLAIRVASFYAFGLFRGIWRYTSARDAIDIFKATTLSTLVLTAILVVFFQTFPRSVIAIDYMLALMLVGGVRFSIRAFRPPNVPLPSK